MNQKHTFQPHEDGQRIKVPPFDTGKVKIGINYVEDTRPPLGVYDEILQEALMGKRYSTFERLFGEVPRITPSAAITALLLCLVVAGFIQR